MKKDPFLRFLSHTRSGDTKFEGTWCVEYIGERTRTGYGRFWCGGKRFLTHVWIYQHYRGIYPRKNEEGVRLEINHLCSNRSCVNLSHLELTTYYGNIFHKNSNAIAKLNADKTCCPKCGEDYVIRISKSGGVARHCRSCKNANERARYHRKKKD